MKKFIKCTAILGLIFSVLGFGVAGAASCWGGRWYRDLDRYDITIPVPVRPEDHMGGDRHGMEDEGVIERWIEDKLQAKLQRWDGEWIDGDTACFPVKEELDLEVVRGNVTIVPGDVEKIQIACDGLDARQGRWIGSSMEEDRLELYISGGDEYVPELEITIPRDTRFQDVEVSMAAGNCTIAGLHADDLEVELAAGHLEIDRGEIRDLCFQCGAGSILYTGRVEGDVNVGCAAGAVQLQLYGEENAFNYSLEGTGGSVKVGELSLDGLLLKKDIDNDAAKDIDLQCAAGNIQVDFLGEDM